MTDKTITLHITNLPGGGVSVSTNAGTPCIGQSLTPAAALAVDLLNLCLKRASDVRYWQQDDPAYSLAKDLIHPDQFGHAVTHEVHNRARDVLGLPRLPHGFAPPPPNLKWPALDVPTHPAASTTQATAQAAA